MKKILLALVATLSLNSCVKSWSCNCVQTIPATSSTMAKTERFSIPVSGTKKDANKQCNAGDTPAGYSGASSIECSVGD